MAATNDTIADIIEEMRFHGQQNIDVEKDKPEYGILTMEGRIAQNYADRLDAAHKRESGDCAKLREALKATLDLFWDIHNSNRSPQSNQAYAVIRQIKAALAAPARNCDKYANHNDAMKAFEAFVREQDKLGFVNPYTEAFKWLFAPATEQEGDVV